MTVRRGTRRPRSRSSSPSRPSSSVMARAGSPSEKAVEAARAGRGAGPARCQARRHRLDHAGVRRCVSRPELADGGRRDDREPLPRLRVAATDARHRGSQRSGRLRARSDIQPRGRASPARADADRHGGRRYPWPRRRRTPAQAPMGSVGAVVGANLASVAEVAINGPILAPGFGAQGGTVDDVRRPLRWCHWISCFRRRRATCSSRPRRGSLRARQVTPVASTSCSQPSPTERRRCQDPHDEAVGSNRRRPARGRETAHLDELAEPAFDTSGVRTTPKGRPLVKSTRADPRLVAPRRGQAAAAPTAGRSATITGDFLRSKMPANAIETVTGAMTRPTSRGPLEVP